MLSLRRPLNNIWRSRPPLTLTLARFTIKNQLLWSSTWQSPHSLPHRCQSSSTPIQVIATTSCMAFATFVNCELLIHWRSTLVQQLFLWYGQRFKVFPPMTFSFTFQTNSWCQFVLRNPRTSWALLCFSVLAIRRPWWPCFASLAEPAGLCKHCRWKEVHCTAAVYTADLRIQCTYLSEGVCGYAFPLPVNWLPPTTRHPPDTASTGQPLAVSLVQPTLTWDNDTFIWAACMDVPHGAACPCVSETRKTFCNLGGKNSLPGRSKRHCEQVWFGHGGVWTDVTDRLHRLPTGRDSADSASQKRATGWGFPPLFWPLWPPKD